MRSALLLTTAAAGLVAFGNADARTAADQAAPPAEQTTSNLTSVAGQQPKVIVRGKRELASKITAFVDELTDFHLGDPGRGLARWQDPVCPSVTGLPKEQGTFILERISEVARAAGAPLAGERCRPNLFVFVSSQPKALLQALEKRRRSATFGDGASQQLIDEFIATPRPVRTWYDTMTKTPDGLPMLVTSMPGITTGQAAEEAGHGGGYGVTVIVPVNGGVSPSATANTWAVPSRLTLNAVWAIYRVLVVIDPTQLKGVSLGQIADYVAMAGLAQVKLDAQLGDAPTVLTLFDNPPQAANRHMTDWDRAFLKSLYSTQQKSRLQRSEIAQDMVRQISP